MASSFVESLSRLHRSSLVDLCLKWSQTDSSTPYLASNRNLLESNEEDYLYEPAENVAMLKKLYSDLKQEGEDGGLTKRDIVDRIVDGDWRRGLSLGQLADIDFAFLAQNDTSMRWSALRLVPYKSIDEDAGSHHPAKKRKISSSATHPENHYPTISPASFVANLKSHVGPLVKAHYTLRRLPQPSNLVILRLYITPNVPFAPVSSNIPRNVRQATDSGRVLYIALPDSCPYVYISLSGSTESSMASKTTKGNLPSISKIDIAATKKVIIESIPKALSKPQERWSLEHTKLSCRSLNAMALLRGNGRPGTAGGCYSKFSEEYEWKPQSQSRPMERCETTSLNRTTQAEPTPLTVAQPKQAALSEAETTHELSVSTRFGQMTRSTHARLDRFHLTIINIFNRPATIKAAPVAPRRSKRKRRSLEDIEAGRDDVVEGPSKPGSMAITKTEPAQISLTFSGTDVFRGLKELALVDGGKYVDLERLPSWLTGEKGVSAFAV